MVTSTFLSFFSHRAVSHPTSPPPIIIVDFPASAFSVRTSSAASISAPGIFSIFGLEPVARMISSALDAFNSSMVIVLLSCTSTPSFFNWRSYQRIKAWSSSLNPGAPPGIKLPPRDEAFSHKVTLWPLIALTLAASIPATPPPTINISLDAIAGVRPYSASRPHAGLTAQEIWA